MKKIKIFLIIMLLFLISGCTPKLTYTILDGEITENIEINFDNNYTSEEVRQKLEYYSFRGNMEILIDVEKTDFGYKGTATSSNSMDLYFNNNNAFINECYETVDYVYKNKKHYINTSVGFQCMTYEYNLIDEVQITVQTYNKVYEHNADEVKGTKYTWNITNDNASNQSILFVVGDNQYVWYYKLKFLGIGLGVVCLIALITKIIISVFKNISKKVNSI